MEQENEERRINKEFRIICVSREYYIMEGEENEKEFQMV
jgi:hypothetical protein